MSSNTDRNMQAKARKVRLYDVKSFLRNDGNEKSADYVEGRRVYVPPIGSKSTTYDWYDSCAHKHPVWYANGCREVYADRLDAWAAFLLNGQAMRIDDGVCRIEKAHIGASFKFCTDTYISYWYDAVTNEVQRRGLDYVARFV